VHASIVILVKQTLIKVQEQQHLPYALVVPAQKMPQGPLTKRLRVRNLFGEPNESHFEPTLPSG
jgi:hypothetical protein